MKTLILIGKITTLISFIIGSILLILCNYLKGNNQLEHIGLMYVIIAFIINCILLFIIVISAIINSHYRIELLKTAALMLINIPIAIGYFWIFLNTLDFTNAF